MQFIKRRHCLQVGALLLGHAWMRASYGQSPQRPPTVVVEVDLSTTSRDVGLAIEAGVRLALAAQTQAPRVEVINSQGNVRRAQDALHTILMQSSVLAVIGGGDANVSRGLRVPLQQAAIPYAMVWTNDPSTTERDAWTFRFGLSDQQCLNMLIPSPPGVPAKRWGFLLSHDAVGRASYDALGALLASNAPPEVVGVQWHDLSAHNLSSHWHDLLARGAEAIWFAGHPRATRILASLIASSPRKFQRIPILASPHAWSARLGGSFDRLQRLPLYFALPDDAAHFGVSASHALELHPAKNLAFRVMQTLLESNALAHSGVIERTTIRASWAQLQQTVAHASPRWYQYQPSAQWQSIPLSRILASIS
jgi:hypothetical protein